MNENTHNFIKALRDLCDKYLQSEIQETPTQLFPPEEETTETEAPQKVTFKPYKTRPRTGKPSQHGFATVGDLAAHFKKTVPELKRLMDEHGIPYGTYLKELYSSGHSNYVKPDGIAKLNELLVS